MVATLDEEADEAQATNPGHGLGISLILRHHREAQPTGIASALADHSFIWFNSFACGPTMPRIACSVRPVR